MTFTQKQIETILSLPTDYVFRYSMQYKDMMYEDALKKEKEKLNDINNNK